MDWSSPENLAHIVELSLFGYFLFLQRRLIQKIDDTHTILMKLKTEHDTYKSMNKCPLISSATTE